MEWLEMRSCGSHHALRFSTIIVLEGSIDILAPTVLRQIKESRMPYGFTQLHKLESFSCFETLNLSHLSLRSLIGSQSGYLQQQCDERMDTDDGVAIPPGSATFLRFFFNLTGRC